MPEEPVEDLTEIFEMFDTTPMEGHDEEWMWLFNPARRVFSGRTDRVMNRPKRNNSGVCRLWPFRVRPVLPRHDISAYHCCARNTHAALGGIPGHPYRAPY